jgi:hypothetical protein
VPRSGVYRSVATTWAGVGSLAGAAVFFALALTGGRGSVAAYVIGALLLVVAWRMWIAGFRVEADSVKVVTLFRSRRVSWSEIDHFAVMPLGTYPYVGYVVLRDGRKFGTFGLSASSRKAEANRLRVQRPVDALNQVLADRRASTGQSRG